MPEAVIVDVVRTASGRGKPGGALSGVHPANLLAAVIAAVVERNGIDGATIDDVIAGCVGQAGDQALNIGRTAVLVAGLPESVPATTIDRQCGSSQQALHFAVQGVMAGSYDIAIACGVESMSRVPMGSANAGGDAFAPLAARYPEGLVNQGVSAELITKKWDLSRARLDEYAARSHERASSAARDGAFEREILPIAVAGADGSMTAHLVDETVRATTTAEGLSGLRSSFRTDELAARFPDLTWDITPGNSSPLTDGASATLVMSADRAAQLGLKPRARVTAMAVTGSDPLLMLTGVIPATEKVLARAGLTIDDIDAYEVNEAFAPVPLAWAAELGADESRLNPLGGAIALGHPLGGSGTRLLTTLLHHLESTGGRYGLQTMCEGGGMANATVIERIKLTVEQVRYAVEGHVAVITLDRPDRLNAFTDTMERELIECFDHSDADDEVRVVVLTGAGRAFCAGMDLAETDPRDTFTSWRASASAPAGTQFDVDGSDLPVRRDGGGRVVLRIFDSLKPVISAINGHAVGVGATMTLPTDLRLGADGAKFAFPFVQRAFVPESCSSWFLPRVVPMQVATEWMLTGRTFDAEEALRGGLLRSTHPAEDVLPAAMDLAHEIADSTSAVSASATRRMLWAMLTASHPMQAHEIETLALNDRGVSADAREGVAAFVEKRRPTFRNRVSNDSPAVLDTLVRPDYTPPGDPR